MSSKMDPSCGSTHVLTMEDFTTQLNASTVAPFSYVFPIESSGHEFLLEVRPKGTNPEFISVFLSNYSCASEELRVRFELSILNQNSTKCCSKVLGNCKFGSDKVSTGKPFSRYMKRNYLLDPTHAFVTNSAITLIAEIKILNDAKKPTLSENNNINEQNILEKCQQIDGDFDMIDEFIKVKSNSKSFIETSL